MAFPHDGKKFNTGESGNAFVKMDSILPVR